MDAPRGDPTDRISLLPDEVLYHILSFLDVCDAVRLGMLSRRWERLCSAIPFLNIDFTLFCHRQNPIIIANFRELCEQFKDFVNWVLTSRASINITELRLSSVPVTAEQVFSWISAAASRNVQELVLTFNPYQAFFMPFSLVKGQSLQFMELDLLGNVLQLPRYAGFRHLKCLRLNRIRLNDEDLARSFFSGCPSLEELVLSYCTFEDIKVLDISSISIEHLSVENGLEDVGYDKMDFKISCPKLTFFKYDAPAPRHCILDRVSSLEIIHFDPWNDQDDLALKGHVFYFIGLLKLVPNVAVLKLGFDIISGFCGSFDELSCTLCTFHGLKTLNLQVTLVDDKMRFLVLLLEHSPKLEALILYFDNDWVEDVKFPDFSTISCLKNSVRTIQLIDLWNTINEIELARNLLRCGLVLKRFVLYSAHGVKPKEISELVCSFPRSSSSVEVVISGLGST